METLTRVEVTSRSQLRRWLQRHHAQTQSIWLVTYKKSAGARYVAYDSIVEEALCFGWVDSLPRKLDSQRSMRLLSPRKPGSAWSRVNKNRIAALIAAGKMQPSGLAKVDAAKVDGSWKKLDRVETLRIPRDLAVALKRDAVARKNFMVFPPSTRRAILEWISSAKQAETRARRIRETTEKAKLNIRANQYRQAGVGTR